MNEATENLLTLGFAPWQEQAGSDVDSVARVLAVDRDQMLLAGGRGQFRARLSGSYRYHHPRPQDLPCVGDWVTVSHAGADGVALIQTLLPRRTLLKRKAAGDNVEYQLIAANADVVVVMQSCALDFNIKRLERYLIMIREGGCEPLILLSKTDLVSPAELAALKDEIATAGIQAPLLTLSSFSGAGLAGFMQQLQPQKTYCFVGSSGVGKSTLINYLLGRSQQSTQTVSGTGEGRHTTVRRELFVLDNGALIIDNPGMRELGIMGAGQALDDTFDGLLAQAGQCRFRNCTHHNEPGCAVRAALEAEGLSQQQLDHYRQLQQETDFNDMSYAEKREKDRNFGRFIKDAKKNMRKK